MWDQKRSAVSFMAAVCIFCALTGGGTRAAAAETQVTERMKTAEEITAGEGIEAVLLAQDAVRENLPGIICWGDSLTYGWQGEGVSYPLVLRERLKNGGLDIPVVNMGSPGEDSLTIAGRSGGIPFLVAEDVVIGADTVPVEIAISSYDGRRVMPSLTKDVGINECFIGGIAGTLKIVEHRNPESAYTFTRSTPGEAVTVSAGTEIVTEAGIHYQDYLSVLFIGTNGGYDSLDDLVAQQNAIIASRTANTDRFLIVGLTYGTGEEQRAYDHAMYAEYGERYFNLREYLCTYGMADAGLTPTANDLHEMQVGSVPGSLRSDLIHFNAAGYALVGDAIYEKMNALGYFDEAKRLAGKVLQRGYFQYTSELME